MSKKELFNTVYLCILAITLGSGIFAGAITAPVVFNANDYIAGVELTNFQMGSLMAEIFRKLGFIVNISIIAIIINESIDHLSKKRGWFGAGISILAVLSGYMFSFYFVPEILNMQKIGAEETLSENFVQLHESSEIWFKIYILSIAMLFVHKIVKNR